MIIEPTLRARTRLGQTLRAQRGQIVTLAKRLLAVSTVKIRLVTHRQL